MQDLHGSLGTAYLFFDQTAVDAVQTRRFVRQFFQALPSAARFCVTERTQTQCRQTGIGGQAKLTGELVPSVGQLLTGGLALPGEFTEPFGMTARQGDGFFFKKREEKLQLLIQLVQAGVKLIHKVIHQGVRSGD